MGLVGGSVTSSSGTSVRGTFAYQGVTVPDDESNTFSASQNATADVDPVAYGTGSGTMDRVTCSDRAIPAGSSVTFDLYTGTTLLDLAGGTCAFRTIRRVKVVIKDAASSTSGVRIGGAASNEFLGWFVAAGDKADIFPGGPPFEQGSPAGKQCASGTANLKIENLDTTTEVVVTVLVAGSVQEAGYAMGPPGMTYP
jgi:hypothetical protein